jgi:hypothetical protein
MNIYILFWVKLFLLTHPYVHVFKFENVKTKHLVYILFKMKMKAKSYGIKILIASHLQLNISSHK